MRRIPPIALSFDYRGLVVLDGDPPRVRFARRDVAQAAVRVQALGIVAAAVQFVVDDVGGGDARAHRAGGGRRVRCVV